MSGAGFLTRLYGNPVAGVTQLTGARQPWLVWAGAADPLRQQPIRSFRLDDLYPADAVIALLHMDIQGTELRALRGAARLLTERRVRLLYLEVEFFPLYEGQPLFWQIGAFLERQGYHLYSLYGRYYHPKNKNVLSWSEALYINDALLSLPDPVQTGPVHSAIQRTDIAQDVADPLPNGGAMR